MNSTPIIDKGHVIGYVVSSDKIDRIFSREPNSWCLKVTTLNMGGKVFSFNIAPLQEIVSDTYEEVTPMLPIDDLDAVYQPSLKSTQNKMSFLDKAQVAGTKLYGIGICHGEHNYGMTDGPTPNLQDMLDMSGTSNSYILQLSGEIDKDIVLYKWDEHNLKWIDVSKPRMLHVKLTYFKRTGKYYTEGHYETTFKDVHEIWDEVKTMTQDGNWPGLTEGAEHEFIILIDVPEHPNNHPKLIIPPKNPTKG